MTTTARRRLAPEQVDRALMALAVFIGWIGAGMGVVEYVVGLLLGGAAVYVWQATHH